EAPPMGRYTEAAVGERVCGPLFEHARPDPLLDVFATAVLEHHTLDALAGEDVGEDQAGRAGAHDPHLATRAPLTFHALSSLRRRRLPTLMEGSTRPPSIEIRRSG